MFVFRTVQLQAACCVDADTYWDKWSVRTSCVCGFFFSACGRRYFVFKKEGRKEKAVKFFHVVFS